MQKLEVGEIVIATVTGITKYGIFVKIDDNVTGLIHISEVSDVYVKKLDKYVTKGEVILVKVLSIKNAKLNLSIKNINYKVKKSCLDIKTPVLKCDPSEYEIFNEKMSEWINDWQSSR